MRTAQVLGQVLWEALEVLREVCEESGRTVILVSSDSRPETAMGAMRPSHRYKDSRVRSLLGDASRRWCHQRYRVEMYGEDHPGMVRQIVTIKDEADGLVGRLNWGAIGRFTPDWELEL